MGDCTRVPQGWAAPGDTIRPMFRTALIVSCCLYALPAFPQSVYIVGAVGGDIVRTSRSEINGREFPDGDGEVVSAALRVGTSLASRWGVELDLVRPGELESDFTSIPIPIPLAPAGLITPDIGAFPIFERQIHVTRRHSTLSTSAWVRQRASDSVDLVYLAGLGFSRDVQKIEVNFNVPPRLAAVLPVRLQRTRTITYGVGPVVGMDARIELTDHLRLIPAIRLHGLGGDGLHGWLIRPSIGMGWWF